MRPSALSLVALGHVCLAACVPRSLPPPSPVPTGGELAIDPTRAPFRPILPPVLVRQGVVIAGVYQICTGTDGRVRTVSIVKGADPRVDGDWMRTLRNWRYRPFLVGGRPLPLCRQVRLDVRAG